jgi:hypothetical protein
MATSERAYTSARYFVELDGQSAGLIMDASGGEPVAVVTEAAPDANGVIKKELGTVGYEPIVLQVSTGASQELYDWIASVPARQQKAHDGAIVFADHNNRERARLSWSEGLISEVAFPALDASSKDAVRIAVTIQPRSTTYVRSSGTAQASFSSQHGQKRFLAANFRVSIDELPTFNSRVSKVEPISVRQDIEAGEGGPSPGAVHVGNVEVTGSEAFSSDLRAWFDDFVVKGNNGDKNERSMTVELLAPNAKETLLTLTLKQVGIYALGDVRHEQGKEAVARVRAGLYAEELSMAVDKSIVGTVATPPPPPPPTKTTTGETTPDTYLDGWRIGARVDRPQLTVERVAARLMGTVAAPPIAQPVVTREDEGRRFGEMWAREIASLGELDAVAELAVGEWTTATLPDDHSLLRALDRAGEAADVDVTTLSDDPFIRGVVTGATGVRNELEGLLKA